MPYIGNQPGTGVRSRFIYTATASQTTFSGADDNSKTLKYADSNYIDVYLNGVCLEPGTDYTASTKTSVVLTQAASLGDTLKVIAYDVASMDDSISKADGGTFEADITLADGADLIMASAGTSNFRAGLNAGNSIESGGNYNTVVGDEAGTAITTGDNNTLIGYVTGDAITTGGSNTAVGSYSMTTLTTGNHNVAVGTSALDVTTTGSQNVAVGRDALGANTTASENVSVGYQSMFTNTTGNQCVAVGTYALYPQTTGNANVAVGYNSGGGITTASNNTIMGFRTGQSLTTGGDTTAVGAYSGYSATTGTRNTYVGKNAGYYNTTATGNTLIGHASNGNGAGQSITTGSNNTVIGGYNGNQENLDIRTLNHHVVLSGGDGTIKGYFNTSGGFKARGNVGSDLSTTEPTHELIGNHGSAYYSLLVATTSGSGSASYPMAIRYVNHSPNDTNSLFLQCYDNTQVRAQIRSNGSFTSAANSYVAYSDIKLKENIVDSGSQWDDIKALQVKKYSMKEDSLDAPNMIGVIAQDLESAGMNGLVETNSDAFPENPDATTTTKTVKYSVLYMKAVKALQEAMARIETLETEVAALKG